MRKARLRVSLDFLEHCFLLPEGCSLECVSGPDALRVIEFTVVGEALPEQRDGLHPQELVGTFKRHPDRRLDARWTVNDVVVGEVKGT